tara:strand:+ start:364 stop:543 length:180 start_codon:yes stop_codon:yes gene_type:complete
MKVFFIAILFLIPMYFWYRLIMRVDRVFFEGRTKDVILYLMIGLGWVLLAFAMSKILGV